MKKVLIHLIFVTYIISVMNIPEVYKSGYILNHFLETKKENTQLTFIEFMVMHYITDDHNSLDNSQDHKLPFKSNTHLITDTLTLSIHKIVNYTFIISIFDVENITNFQPKIYLSYYLHAIWNPPKFG